MPLPSLTTDETLRYSRHLLLPGVGLDGQRRLKGGRVLLVGAGGLGSPAALYLAAAGVGHLGVVDFDVVDVTNLQRQILHGTSDVGRSKLDSARDAIAEINPHVNVETVEARLTSANALDIIREHDIVVDGSDNFPTRYLTNDACVILGKPNVYGSVFRFEGQASVFATESGPCYRCLFREPPPPGLVPSCAEAGVLGVLPGLVGVIQATETIKLLLGAGDSLAGRLLLIDALRMQFRTLQLERDPTCPACGTRTIRELIDYDDFCGLTNPVNSAVDEQMHEYSPADLLRALSNGELIDLLDVREPHEWEIAHIAGARLVPLGSLEQAMQTISAEHEIVVYCKGGTRGAQAVRTLRAAGFARVSNLAGGILRWREEVDQTLVKY
ncbi:MAG: molybdopterin-synthase adenylyltransferase MoeB [Anaerolineae bacterium]|nr:molybdopterin-synthase adenylyltransferase MoeB [Gemmatimonadaceae bacterium]